MATITKFSQLDLEQTYSYANYLRWKFNKDKVMLMSPPANVNHLCGQIKSAVMTNYF
jgi:hypothetical protein